MHSYIKSYLKLKYVFGIKIYKSTITVYAHTTDDENIYYVPQNIYIGEKLLLT